MPYYVYAIKLDKEAFDPPKAFREQNPHIDWDYPLHKDCRFYYVGQSAHSPDCRFAQHKHCHGDKIRFKCQCKIGSLITKSRSNRFARKYGMYLSRKEFEKHNPIRKRADAEEMEEILAGKLRRKGHAAYYN